MRRITILTLCAMVTSTTCIVTAMSAQTAVAAQAPEYGQCVLLTKTTIPKTNKGEYERSNCQTVLEAEKKGQEPPKHKGAYEWFPGPSPTCVAHKKGNYTEGKCETVAGKVKKGHFTPDHKGSYEKECAVSCAGFTTSGAATFYVSGGGPEVVCASSEGTGEIASPTEAAEAVAFSGCSSNPGGSCKNVTAALVTELDASLFSGEVGKVVVIPGDIAFECGSYVIEIKSSALGILTGNTNTMAAASVNTFALNSEHEQLPPGTGHELQAEWFNLNPPYESGGPAPTGLEYKESNTYEEADEVRTSTQE